jgi:filamentous hemagglutinin family protein
MKKFARIQKNLLSTTAITAIGMMSVATPALAIDAGELPTGGTVASGEAGFSYNGNQLDVNQGTNNVVIDWATFNIGGQATTQFNQPGASSVAVNRISDVNPSQILGNLRANGQVVLLNTNGVFFGQNSTVDVSGLLVSTGTIDADAFMNDGSINLSNINSNLGAEIRNDGNITIQNAGLAAFVAPNLVNNGVINAHLGKIALASGGDAATVDLYGDGLVEMQLGANASRALISNNGTLKADGGTIAVTAKAASNVVDSVINMGGVVEANTVGMKNGKIILSAGNADVHVTGQMNAKGGDGQIKITSDKNIGVWEGAELNADGGVNGNGGIIEVIAQQAGLFFGNIFARGGTESGNGGYVDTSGLEYIDIGGNVDASANNGIAGLWFIDPRDLVIDNSSSNVQINGTPNGPFSPAGGAVFSLDQRSHLRAATLNTALTNGTNVLVTTLGSPNFPLQDGTITIDANITKSGGSAAGTLTMTAAGSITLNAGRTISANPATRWASA